MAIGKITSKSLAADAVTSANLAPGAVTISDIPDSEITADKLHTTLDLSTKTLTLTQASVTAHESALTVTQSQISDLSTTSDLAEGTNLYYTDARADARAQLKIDALVGAAPGTLDTLEELGDALGDDPNFATTVTNSIATKLPLAGGTLTGNITTPQIEIGNGSAGGTSEILFSDNVSGRGKIKYNHGSNPEVLTLETTGTIGLSIDNAQNVSIPNGRVGIGTSSPASKLDVRGELGANGSAATPTAYFVNNQSGATSSSIYIGASLGIDWKIGKNVTGISGNTNFSIADSSSNRRFDIDASGNVGIGTDGPEVKLEVNGGADGSVVFAGRSDGGNGNNRRFNLLAYADGGGSNYGGGLKIQTRDHVNVFYDRITVRSNGNVGIGTTTPSSLLSVGEVPTHNPGSAFTSSPSAFYSTSTLGGTAGNDQKIATFAGEDAANVSGLAMYRYRRSTGTNWTTDGFSLRQEVDNTENIFDYINFAGGKVGMGTSSPSERLHVSGNILLTGNLVGSSITTEIGQFGSNSVGAIKRIRMTQGGELHFGDTTTSNFLGITEGTVNQFSDQDRLGIYYRNELKLYSNTNTLRVTFDSFGNITATGNITTTGNVGIGTTNPQQLLHIHNSSGAFGAEAVLTGRLSTGTPKAEVAFKRGTSGDGAMLVLRPSNSSGSLTDVVTIKDNEVNTNQRFNVTVNQNSNFVAKFINNGGGGYGIGMDMAAGNHFFFYRSGSGTGTITDNGSNVSYNTSSDYRLKEDIVDLDGAVDRLKQLQPRRFKFIGNDKLGIIDGFIAHEVQAVIPDAVDGKKDAVDADGNIVPQAIDQSRLVPLLTAALQEALIKIEQLEARIDKLENK